MIIIIIIGEIPDAGQWALYAQNLIVKVCPHWRRRFRRQFLAENGDCPATVAIFGNSRHFRRQCEQG